MDRIFLAADAGQPDAPVVVRGRDRARELAWADPTLRAHEGRSARGVLEAAAASVAAAVGAPGAAVAFYPGAAAALSAAVAGLPAGRMVAVGATDRLLLRTAAEARAAVAGANTAIIEVDRAGRLELEGVQQALRDGATAVATSVGNQEVGTLQPVAGIAAVCRADGALLVLDATMAAGRAPLPSQWDVLVLDARSWAGGAAVAAVVARPEAGWTAPPAADGPPQLPWLSPAVADCAAAALGLETAVAGLAARAATDMSLTGFLRERLAELPDVQVHGDPQDRLPHVVGFSALYVDAEALLLALDRRGIAVASGSACAAESGQPSHVLAAMGALTSGNVRVTLPIGATEADIAALVAVLPQSLADLRAEAGL